MGASMEKGDPNVNMFLILGTLKAVPVPLILAKVHVRMIRHVHARKLPALQISPGGLGMDSPQQIPHFGPQVSWK